jgi:hypothetical protein
VKTHDFAYFSTASTAFKPSRQEGIGNPESLEKEDPESFLTFVEPEIKMENPKSKCAVNYEFLRSLRPVREDEFDGQVSDESGEAICRWTAYKLSNHEKLNEFLKLKDADVERIDAISDEIWPLAYLERIDSNPARQGFGSTGLNQFEIEAKELGCKICLTRIGWSDDEEGNSRMEANLAFYRKNRWNFLFDLDSDGIPDSLPLAFKSI